MIEKLLLSYNFFQFLDQGYYHLRKLIFLPQLHTNSCFFKKTSWPQPGETENEQATKLSAILNYYATLRTHTDDLVTGIENYISSYVDYHHKTLTELRKKNKGLYDGDEGEKAIAEAEAPLDVTLLWQLARREVHPNLRKLLPARPTSVSRMRW